MDLIGRIIANVLESLYRYAFASIIIAILSLFLLLYIKDKGLKASIQEWWIKFKQDSKFRKIFFLMFYLSMIAYRTLLNRALWMNPLSDVWGIWGIYDSNGQLYTENIENILLFIPLSILILSIYNDNKRGQFLKVFLKGVLFSVSISAGIEMLQLFLYVGTLQISDLCFNAMGGVFGSFLYIAYEIFVDKKSGIKKDE